MRAGTAPPVRHRSGHRSITAAGLEGNEPRLDLDELLPPRAEHGIDLFDWHGEQRADERFPSLSVELTEAHLVGLPPVRHEFEESIASSRRSGPIDFDGTAFPAVRESRTTRPIGPQSGTGSMSSISAETLPLWMPSRTAVSASTAANHVCAGASAARRSTPPVGSATRTPSRRTTNTSPSYRLITPSSPALLAPRRQGRNDPAMAMPEASVAATRDRKVQEISRLIIVMVQSWRTKQLKYQAGVTSL